MKFGRSPLAASALASALLVSSLSACLVDDDAVGDPQLENVEHDRGGRDPIVFVHGCSPPGFTNQMSADLFIPMMDDFAARGVPADSMFALVFSGAPCASIEAHAEELAQLVSEARAITGKQKVDLIGHSMGALISRWYITHGGDRFVRDVVTLGGANHGGGGAAGAIELQEIFGFPAYEGMKQMFPPYACEGETLGGATDIQFELNGCLTPTGRTVNRDETPFEHKGLRYLSIRNTIDEIVTPVEAACIDQKRQNDCSNRANVAVTVPPGPGCGEMGCPGHVTMLFDPGVIETVFSFVSRR
jgi:hypothetical protein